MTTATEARPPGAGGQLADRVVREVIERHGRLDILVNNAGVTIDKTVAKMGDQDWLRVISIDLSGAFFLAQAALEHMLVRGTGRLMVHRSQLRPGDGAGLTVNGVTPDTSPPTRWPPSRTMCWTGYAARYQSPWPPCASAADRASRRSSSGSDRLAG